MPADGGVPDRACGSTLNCDDQRTLGKANALIRGCMRDPFRGPGKPEPLEGNLKGWWSRRIMGEHRLVYRVTGKGEAQALEVAQCRYHY